jgi:aminoglycoside phosphotransferase (APT) family kinase protein
MSEPRDSTDASARALIERVLGEPVADAEKAVWGFQNRTDIVTLEAGERVVVQCYRRRGDAERRLRIMRGLSELAAAAGIPIPRVRAADLDAHPPWVVFAALPGTPVPEPGEFGLEGARFPETAGSMGELLARIRGLPTAGLELDALWSEPDRLAARAARWADDVALGATERAALAALLERVPTLFARRPVVLAHGDFAPVNMLIDRGVLTGLVDFESVRLADPLFDVAWWAWAVRFTSASVLETAWPAFLHGAGIDANEPDLADRVNALQVLRMLELLGGERRLDGDIAGVVLARLRAMLQTAAPSG